MAEKDVPTPEALAATLGKRVRSVSRGGILWVGSLPSDEVAGEASKFQSTIPIILTQLTLNEYVRKLSGKKRKPNRPQRIDILERLVTKKLRHHILSGDTESEERAIAFVHTQVDVEGIFSLLKGRRLGPKYSDNPFIRSYTRGNKVEVRIDGIIRKVEMKGVCPVSRDVRRLYSYFNDLIENIIPSQK